MYWHIRISSCMTISRNTLTKNTTLINLTKYTSHTTSHLAIFLSLCCSISRIMGGTRLVLLVLSLFYTLGYSSSHNTNKEFNYTQTLDHFSYGEASFSQFQQRYFIDETNWSGAKEGGPIFVFLGGESSIEDCLGNVGILNQCALRFRALLLYIEHRFYGSSVPTGSIDKAMIDPNIIGYLTAEQALADFAEIILSLKANLSASRSPVIVVGGSYAGMLAAWFRLKFPHIAMGALASSAPILYFDNIVPEQDQYCSIVSKDFKDTNQHCHDKIHQSWSIIEKMGEQPDGLNFLSQKFNTCMPLSSTSELETFLSLFYTLMAQYDGRNHYMTKLVCKAIHGSGDIITGVANAVTSTMVSDLCYDVNVNIPGGSSFSLEPDALMAWKWQKCTEVVYPTGCGTNSMLPVSPFNVSEYTQNCKRMYGVTPRPHWIADYYGGQDIKTHLKDFGSRIIFSNGLRDPYSSASVLQDISKSIVSINTKHGSHCLDVGIAHEDDPKWLRDQREKEMTIFASWISGAPFKFVQHAWLSFLLCLLCFIVIS